MGVRASVGSKVYVNHCHSTANEEPPLRDFDDYAEFLASAYHSKQLALCLGGGEDVIELERVGSTGSVERLSVKHAGDDSKDPPSLQQRRSPPPPRAERKRLSRQVVRSIVAVGEAERCGDNINNGGIFCDRGSVIGAGHGQDDRPLANCYLDGYHNPVVERHEMIRLARNLGYDITPAQAEKMFDLLDRQGRRKILKHNLLLHFLPLLEGDDAALPTSRNLLNARRESNIKDPRRPRPSGPPPTTRAPPRPAGEPPPSARRRITCPLGSASDGGGGGGEVTMVTATASVNSEALATKPANFWRRSCNSINMTTTRNASQFRADVVDCEMHGESGGCVSVAASGLGWRGVSEELRRFTADVEEGESGDHVGGSVSHGSGVNGNRNSNYTATIRGETGRSATPGHGHNNATRGEHGISEQQTGGSEVAIPLEGVQTNISTEVSIRSNHNRASEDESAVVLLSSYRDTNDDGDSGRESTFVETWARQSMMAPGKGRRRCTVTAAVALPSPATVDKPLGGKNIEEWTAADVRKWLGSLPRGLSAFAEAEAFVDGSVDGMRLATLTMKDVREKKFHHTNFRAKVPTALWVEIKKIQPKPASAMATPPVSSRFVAGESIVDEAARTPLCTVTHFVGQGAFGEVYQVVWTGVGKERGTTLAMKTVRLADINTDKRDEYRVLLVEEILAAVRVMRHPNVVNVRFAHILGYCSEGEEYICFEDFVTGRDLEELVGEGDGKLYDGSEAEVQGRLLSYAIQLARGLGHIHRCGVLHQDIKSANVMVSNDGWVLITDFGFATVGHFEPPSAIASPSTPEGKVEPALKDTPTRADPKDNGAGSGSGEQRGKITAAPAAAEASLTPAVLRGTLKGFTPRYQSPEICAIMSEKAQSSNGEEVNTPFTHRSDMWAAGVVILEMYAGGLKGLRSGRGDNAPALLEELVRNRKSKAVSTSVRGAGDGVFQGGEQGGDVTGIGAGGVASGGDRVEKGGRNTAATSGELKHETFLVDVPEEVLLPLSEMLARVEGKRPPSMEVVAARLSRALGLALKAGEAVVPSPTAEAPSAASLCDETPAEVEAEDNHGKVGRLHMWLGKALSLKGEDRRGQAIQEYREGVRLLEQSMADQGSPSMALFRWYLGTALLEIGEYEEALHHLTHAVSISPDNSKYRLALAVAKRATGDQPGALSELLDAALWNENGADKRPQPGYKRHTTAVGPDRAAMQHFPQKRSFSIGDEVLIPCCGGVSTGLANITSSSPMWCHPSTRIKDSANNRRNHVVFVIDDFLSAQQASWHCWGGEAYTVRLRDHIPQPSEGKSSTLSQRLYHLVHVQFEAGRRAASTPANAAKEAKRLLAGSGAIEDKSTANPQAFVTHDSPTGVSRKVADEGVRASASRCFADRSTPAASATAASSLQHLSPGSRAPLLACSSMRNRDYLPALKAVGRAAMVGFHVGLAGAVRDLVWGHSNLSAIVDATPGGCSTLREVLGGMLYRESGIGGGGDTGRVEVVGVVNRMLSLARQVAAAISHCHRKGLLLQDVKPEDVLLTPRWNALLCPNYAHAREGDAWSEVSAIHHLMSTSTQSPESAAQHRPSSWKPSGRAHTKHLTAPFSFATVPEYQSPEIASIRTETRAAVRNTRQLSASLKLSGSGRTTTENADKQEQQDDGVATLTDYRNTQNSGGDEEGRATPRIAAVASSHERRGGSDVGGFSGQYLLREDAGSSGSCCSPRVTPSTSDIWAWALIVLQMFSDDIRAPGRGQDGLPALESLLRRRSGVDKWSVNEVIAWLGDIGMSGEGVAREIRTFKIAGPQLLIPTCRRDVVEKLGLFFTDVELASKFWDAIATGLQRWAVPRQLAQILRRCFADEPDNRFSSMDEVCDLLRDVTPNGAIDNNEKYPTSPATNTKSDCGDIEADDVHTAMILNDVGACFHSMGLGEEAERFYKLALLESENLAESHRNLGLLYTIPAFDKFREAQKEFETAAALMDPLDPRRRESLEHARAAERKSKYYQSQEIMRALSGKYTVAVRDENGNSFQSGGRQDRKEEVDVSQRPRTATPRRRWHT